MSHFRAFGSATCGFPDLVFEFRISQLQGRKLGVDTKGNDLIVGQLPQFGSDSLLGDALLLKIRPKADIPTALACSSATRA